MDVRIGVLHAPKELSLEMQETTDEVAAQIDEAVKGDGGFLWLTDKHGTRVGIPLDKLAYVEIEGEDHAKHVGFGA